MLCDRRRFLHVTAGTAVLTTCMGAALAEEFPVRPIRLVIPFPPGGVQDALGRPWADKVKSRLGTVVVENVGGGGGEQGAALVARANSDGYTILIANSSIMVIKPLIVHRVTYDPVASFDSVSMLCHVSLAITINPTLPVHTLGELADFAKQNPGKLSFGTPGIGSLNQLIGEQFKLLVDAPQIVHVPYRGAGPAITDLLGGQIPMSVAAVNGQLLEFHRTGRLRILAVTSPNRLAAAPDLPTVSDAGMPQLAARATTWLFVPKGTPAWIIARISQATQTALADPDLQRKYAASGVEPSTEASSEAATKQLREEIRHWTPVIRTIGLKAE